MTFDQIIVFLTTKHALVIYAIIAASAFIENIFPPYPSDTIILAGAFMAGQGHLSYIPLFISATAGGLAGALLLYSLGYAKGRSYFVKYNKAYLKLENMAKIERWFSRWGDLVLVVSRFVAGVRSIIAVAAGIGKVPPARMTVFSLISFALWYLFLIGGMYLLKSNWHKLVHIIKTYTIFLIIISAVVMTIWLVIIYIRSRKKK
jgi:membrane protein DedA with SNARE-associated domain